MQLRRLEVFCLAAAAIVGGVLPAESLSGDVGRLLVTFLGLLGASILPTISLIMGNMTAGGRSVKALNSLKAELAAAMDALFLLFGLIAVCVAGLLILTVPEKPFVGHFHLLFEFFGRGAQSVISAAAVLIFLRAGQIPAILRRSMAIRHEIAVEEARRKTNEAAPEPGATQTGFANHPDFGKSVGLDELQRREPH